jgi:hypothetical protein
MRSPARLATLVAAWILAASTASAQTCAGFTDTPNDGFCPSIQWIKNRGVTLGCGVNLYCPAGFVRRDQMAAFMNRLGKAITPEILYAQADTGPIALPGQAPTAPELRCNTVDSAVQVFPAQYPRQVTVSGMLSGLADGADAGMNVFPQVSSDGGVTWANLNGNASIGIRTTAKANLWSVASFTETMDIPLGATVRFALGVRRDGVTTTAGNLAQGRCQLAAIISNRNPTSPPF